MKATRKPKAEPVALTFRGLDLCDGCGVGLHPGDRLSGLCPACRDPKDRGTRGRGPTASGSVRDRR